MIQIKSPPRTETSLLVTNKEWLKWVSAQLLIVLVLVLIGALPSWGYSRGWGPFPSGIIGLIVVIVLILVLTGRL